MQLKQSTKNIIGACLSILFIIIVIVVYKIHIVNGKQFQIKNIVIDEDKRYLLSLFASYNIAEGKNIFSFDAKETCNTIEEKLHFIRNVKIVKRLPDEVIIDISHRVPVMRLSSDLLYVTDDTGKIFMSTRKNTEPKVFDSIPILLDHEAAQLRPGDTLNNKAEQALNIVCTFNSANNPNFKITHIDTSDKIYIILYTNKNKRIYIPWNHIETNEKVALAIDIAVDAMDRGLKDPHSNLVILVDQKRCCFTNM